MVGVSCIRGELARAYLIRGKSSRKTSPQNRWNFNLQKNYIFGVCVVYRPNRYEIPTKHVKIHEKGVFFGQLVGIA